MIDASREEMDEAALITLIEQIQPLMVEEMVAIPLWDPLYASAARTDRFKGWLPDLNAVASIQPQGSILQILALEPI